MPEKSTLLIIEDDLDVAEMLNAYFRVQGYEVHAVNWGEDGVRACIDLRPDLVILDIRLPDIDGFEVAERLRSNRRTADIPIIFLTEKRERIDRLKGLELGADDYITKPFDIQELRLRVRNALRRTSQAAVNNPVTGLPEGVLVEERLGECLAQSGWALMAVSLDHLDRFRERYGFVAADDVLRAVSLMIHNAIRDIGSANDFLGHLAPTDFVVVTKPSHVKALEERIRSRLEQSLDYFYPLKDRNGNIPPDERLRVRMGVVLPSDAIFTNVDMLKTALLRARQ